MKKAQGMPAALNEAEGRALVAYGDLDAEEALDFLQGLHGPAARISDVQASRVKRSQERDTTSGHYRQP